MKLTGHRRLARPLHRRLPSWLLISTVALSGCGATAVEDDDTSSDRFIVEMEFRFAPGIFAPDSTSANPIKLYDEGYAVVLDTQREAPARWSTSQSDEEGSNDLGRQNALATHGPIVLHPDLPLRTIQQVQLPAFLCVAVSALSGHTAIRNRPGAVSSNCTPVPESFRTVSAADALAEIQGIGRVWPEVVVINIDTPVSKAVTETFRSVETIIDNVAIAN